MIIFHNTETINYLHIELLNMQIVTNYMTDRDWHCGYSLEPAEPSSDLTGAMFQKIVIYS